MHCRLIGATDIDDVENKSVSMTRQIASSGIDV